MQRSDVNVGVATLHSADFGSGLEIRIDQSTDIFVRAAALAPEVVERPEMPAGQLECPPHPLGSGILLLDLDLFHPAASVGDDRVEQFRIGYREQEKGELPVGQETKAVRGEPNRVRQADVELVIRRHKGQGTEKSVTQAVRILLNR